jgi:hypothetical protein
MDEETGGYELEHLDYIVAGADAWHEHRARDTAGKNLIDYYREGGLDRQSFIMAATNRLLRKATYHEYLRPIEDQNVLDENGNPTLYSRLQVFNTCEAFMKYMPQLVNSERKIDVVADSREANVPDHGYDCCGYALISHHLKHSPQPGVDERTVIQRHKDKLMHGNRRKYRGHVSPGEVGVIRR